MEKNKKPIKIKSISFLIDSIVCEIEPIDFNLCVLIFTTIHKKDVSPEKFILTKGDNTLYFHTKKHLPEYYKNHKEDSVSTFEKLNLHKRIFQEGEVIGEAIELL